MIWSRSRRDQRGRKVRTIIWHGILVFFFQAEDGIRDSSVTGVQTCALPICPGIVCVELRAWGREGPWRNRRGFDTIVQTATGIALRSEERRVGKECRSRWSPYH